MTIRILCIVITFIVPVVTPVRTGYRPDYYINDTLYNVKLNDYDCANRINLRDSNIFTRGSTELSFKEI